MGRRPKQRENFYDDAQYLMRLGKAIVDDPNISTEWREETNELIQKLVLRLMQAPITV
jgi:hypothetical protein